MPKSASAQGDNPNKPGTEGKRPKRKKPGGAGRKKKTRHFRNISAIENRKK